MSSEEEQPPMLVHCSAGGSYILMSPPLSLGSMFLRFHINLQKTLKFTSIPKIQISVIDFRGLQFNYSYITVFNCYEF